jgi:hypothetical protein
MRGQLLSTLTVCFFGFWTNIALSGDCGCGQPAPTCRSTCSHRYCCKHHHRCCCEQPRSEAPRMGNRIAEAPVGQVVESYPVMRAAPTLMAMPMMMVGSQVRMASIDDNRSRSADTTCASSQDRLSDLEDRVNALNDRLVLINKSVQAQTRLLEKLAERGAFGDPVGEAKETK